MSSASTKRRSPLATAAAIAGLASIALASGLFLLHALGEGDKTGSSSTPAPRKRRRIAIATQDIEELLQSVPAGSNAMDEVTVLLYCPQHGKDGGNGEAAAAAEINRRCRAHVSHILRYETSVGVIHMSRHLSPDILILLPSSDQQHTAAIKDWVGQVVVCARQGTESIAARNVHYLDPAAENFFERALAVAC